MQKQGVQFLADYIRARALLQGFGGLSPPGGWFVDGDTIWLRPAPTLSMGDPSNVGHFFGSVGAISKKQGMTRDMFDKHWLLHYLTRQNDWQYLASPFAFPSGSPVLARWVGALEVSTNSSSRVDYHVSFRELTRAIQQWGLEPAIVDKHVCSPVDRLMGDVRVLSASHGHLYDAEVVAAALCVNNYWQSKFIRESGSAVEAGSHSKVQPNSVWSRVLNLAAERCRPCRRKRAKTNHSMCLEHAAASAMALQHGEVALGVARNDAAEAAPGKAAEPAGGVSPKTGAEGADAAEAAPGKATEAIGGVSPGKSPEGAASASSGSSAAGGRCKHCSSNS